MESTELAELQSQYREAITESFRVYEKRINRFRLEEYLPMFCFVVTLAYSVYYYRLGDKAAVSSTLIWGVPLVLIFGKISQAFERFNRLRILSMVSREFLTEPKARILEAAFGAKVVDLKELYYNTVDEDGVESLSMVDGDGVESVVRYRFEATTGVVNKL